MKKIGIIQPGRLGDVIMCLPIAKYYANNGYEVIWPMFNSIANMVKDVVNYVTIYGVPDNVYTCVADARTIFNKHNITNIFDIAATFPGSLSTDDYVRDCNDGFGPEGVDEFKYRKTNVPFDEKWKLHINRNSDQENFLYNKYIKQDEYVVTCLTHSKGSVNVLFDAGSCQVVNMNTDHNIFHWLKILENAKGIICVESSVSNLVDQLMFKNKKFLVTKPGESRKPPVMRCDWKQI